jgi:hypothetical protein
MCSPTCQFVLVFEIILGLVIGISAVRIDDVVNYPPIPPTQPYSTLQRLVGWIGASANSSSGFFYEGEQNGNNAPVGYIIERVLWDLSEIRRSSISFPLPGPTCSFLDPFATFAYLCFPTFDSNQAMLSKVQLEYFEIIASISFPYNSLGSAIVDSKFQFGYYSSLTTIYKVDLSNMVVVATILNVPGPNSTAPGSQLALLSRNGELGYFFYFESNGTVVVTVNLTSFSVLQQNFIETSYLGPGVVDRFSDIAYIQFVTPYADNYTIQTVNLTDFTVIPDKYVVLDGPTHTAFIALNGTMAFFAGETPRTDIDPNYPPSSEYAAKTIATVYEIDLTGNFTLYDVVKLHQEKSINVASLSLNDYDAYFGTNKIWDYRNIAIYKIYLSGKGMALNYKSILILSAIGIGIVALVIFFTWLSRRKKTYEQVT